MIAVLAPEGRGGGTVRRRATTVTLGLLTLNLVAWGPGAARPATGAEGSLVYFGTYTGSGSQGIYVSRFDAETGRLSPPELAASTANPSFLAVHPNGRFLYAVNELDEFQKEKAGAASAFAIDGSTGMLHALGQVSTRGTSPCHVSLDASGRHAFVANYGGGSIAVLPISEDGSLGPAMSFVQHSGHGPNAERQEGPHAHEVVVDPLGQWLWAADLGLDKVLGYRFDAAKGALATPAGAAAILAPGSGPRHFAFAGGGRLLFVLSEMALTVTAFSVTTATGATTVAQTISTLPSGVSPSAKDSGAELQVHPSGRFLYASNRGPDSITVFSIDAAKGTLKQVEVVSSGGRTPRGFSIDPSGRYLLAGNQDSSNVVVFAIDRSTGRLKQVGEPVRVGTPVSVAFVP
jgi:6-phosphogluconolactonase